MVTRVYSLWQAQYAWALGCMLGEAWVPGVYFRCSMNIGMYDWCSMGSRARMAGAVWITGCVWQVQYG
jgi:hypothetical protein